MRTTGFLVVPFFAMRELETMIGYDAYIEKRREQGRTLRESYGYVEVAQSAPFVVLGGPGRPLEGSPKGETG